MSKSYRFTLDRKGVKQLLKSEWAMEVVNSKANEIRGKLGDGYEVTTYNGKTRVNASVHANTVKARQDNAKNNTLLKALGGGER